MGMYYGLQNVTKNEQVSSYWKAWAWCNIYHVMHRYGWEPTDFMFSACYAGTSKFVKEGDKLELVNADYDKNIDENMKMVREFPEKIRSMGFEVEFEYPDMSDDEDFNEKTEKADKHNHLPDWEVKDGVMFCKKCNHQVKEENKIEDEKKFDKTFFMN